MELLEKRSVLHVTPCSSVEVLGTSHSVSYCLDFQDTLVPDYTASHVIFLVTCLQTSAVTVNVIIVTVTCIDFASVDTEW